jgi:hypothetical protein
MVMPFSLSSSIESIFGADAVLTAHLVDLVDAARVEEDALGQGGLAAVDVRGDSNVSREGAIVGGGVGGRAEGCRAVMPRGSRRWRRSPGEQRRGVESERARDHGRGDAREPAAYSRDAARRACEPDIFDYRCTQPAPFR